LLNKHATVPVSDSERLIDLNMHATVPVSDSERLIDLFVNVGLNDMYAFYKM
jgi:hypothetical protein